MTNTIIVAGLSAWGIVGLFAMAFIRGADERRKDRKRETEWRRA
jgi:hypothetical protein